MRIMVISRHRTRSSYIGNSLSRFYNIEDKAQVMDRPLERFRQLHKNYNPDVYYNFFLQNFKLCAETQFSHNNFVMKLFPSMLILSYKDIFDLNDYKLKMIMDISYYTNIKKFDKIFYLDRDIPTSYLSYAYAFNISRFNVNTIDQSLEKPILYLDFNDPHMKFYLYCAALQTKMLEYLKRNNIEFTKLDYDEVPIYVKETMKIEKTKTVDMHNDYKQLVSNYDDLIPKINNFYNLCLDYTQNIKYI